MPYEADAASEDERALFLSKALIVLCTMFAITSSFQRFGIADVLGKGLMALLCVFVLVLFAVRKQPRYAYLIIAIAALVHVVSLLYPISQQEGIATFLLFAFWVLFWLGLKHNLSCLMQAAYSLKSFLLIVLVAWSAVAGFSLLLPICYQVGWGGGRYFVSFTNSSFEITPVAFYFLALDILLYKLTGRKGQAIVLALAPLACAFSAGSRTYFVVIIAGLILLIKMMARSRKAFIALVGIVAILCLIIVGSSGIGEKFSSAVIHTNDIGANLRALTNGRSDFWLVDLKAFLNGTPFEILLGHGFSYVYEVNLQAVGARIYAHNDFLNIVLNFGIIGLLLYFLSILPVVHALKSDRFAQFLFVFVWLFNAMFNSVYVYAVSVCGLGILFVALSLSDVKPNNANSSVLEVQV